MATKSPTSVRVREMIGEDQFSRRREVFDKHDTVFLPPQSPVLGASKELDYVITSNHGTTTANFKRNAPTYSSMRETRNEQMTTLEFRPRKYSDNFTSENNQSDDVDYRHSMTERTRRLSKMRRDFLKSNLHEQESPSFTRSKTRATMPANSTFSYKIESPNLYKFPFAEPYLTPSPVRKVVVNFDSSETDGTTDNTVGTEKENEDPSKKHHQSLPNNTTTTSAIDRQKLFEELLKRYSPPRKPINWNLPPTRPRVVGSLPKSASESTDSTDYKHDITQNTGDDNVFYSKDVNINSAEKDVKKHLPKDVNATSSNNNESDSKTSLTELEEKNDRVPELSTVGRQISLEPKKHSKPVNDLNIPDLIQKITVEGETLEKHTKEAKKVKRKRSFLDKILGRKKN